MNFSVDCLVKWKTDANPPEIPRSFQILLEFHVELSAALKSTSSRKLKTLIHSKLQIVEQILHSCLQNYEWNCTNSECHICQEQKHAKLNS